MKRQYISPETTVVAIDARLQLMAGSITETLKNEEVSDGDDFEQASRQSFNLWSDDED